MATSQVEVVQAEKSVQELSSDDSLTPEQKKSSTGGTGTEESEVGIHADEEGEGVGVKGADQSEEKSPETAGEEEELWPAAEHHSPITGDGEDIEEPEGTAAPVPTFDDDEDEKDDAEDDEDMI